MSRPVKMALLFLSTLVYVTVTWLLFKPPLTFSYPGIWLWIISIFLILGVGFRVITNKFFGNFFFSYLCFGLAGFLIILFAGAKIISLPAFHGSAYKSMIPIEVGEFANYSMGEKDLALIPESVAKQKAAKELVLYVPDDQGFLLMDGYLQKVNEKFVYVFALENQDKKTDSPGFVMMDAITGEVSYKKTSSAMKYSPYKKAKKNNVMKLAKEMSHNINVGMFHLELDEELNPYWIGYSYKPAVSFMGTKGVYEVFVCNPFTGTVNNYYLEYLDKWIDYQYSLEVFPTLFKHAAKQYDMDLEVNEKPVMMPRGNQLFAYYNMQNKDGNAGVAFVNMSTFQTKLYPIDTVGSERVMECLEAWEISSGAQSYQMPILSNVDGHPAYVSSMFDQNGSITSYLMLDALGGSYYTSGATWAEVAAKFASEVGMQTQQPAPETPQNPEEPGTPDTQPPSTEPDGEGVTYNLIAGFVQDYVLEGDQYVVTLMEMKPKYYIPAALITEADLNAGRDAGITLQYPIQYDGQLEVRDCIPVLATAITPG